MIEGKYEHGKSSKLNPLRLLSKKPSLKKTGTFNNQNRAPVIHFV